MPEAVLEAENPIPYTLTAYSLYSELDGIAHRLCLYFDRAGFSAVPIPADTPYISWNESEKRGQGIISLKHAAQLAGLGFLGRSTLLINPKFGNLVYIGAILTVLRLQPDPILKSFHCPESCKICINVCPKGAIGTLSVNQKLCREVSFHKNERGFDIYDCKECRKRCPLRNGQKKNEKFPG